VAGAFLTRYRETMAGAASFPDDPEIVDALIAFFTLEKVFYEIDYELANRPQWVGIPLAGALALLDEREAVHAPA
jgi:maltose alpha-D-glucosyltransferase / alpha-amylase